MNRNARLAAYAAALGLLFGGGTALGAAIGPEPPPEDPGTATVHEDRSGPAHESEH